jgi:hypothetical protein
MKLLEERMTVAQVRTSLQPVLTNLSLSATLNLFLLAVSDLVSAGV